MWIKKKISEILNSRKSEDYQRLLASIRVYTSILWQNKNYSNILLIFFTMVLLASIVPVISIYYLKNELFVPYYVYSVSINLLMIIMVLILVIWSEHQFKVLKTLKIIIFNKFNFSFTLLVFSFMVLSLITGESSISISEAFYLLIIVLIYSYSFILFFGIADFLENKSITDFSIQQLKEIDNKNKKIISRYQLYYYSIFLYYNKIYKNMSNMFKENVTIINGLNYILLLSSEIFYNDEKYREKILDILTRLKETDPFENNKEFLEIIKDIRTNFNKRFLEIYGKEPDEKIFYYRSRLKQIKSFLLVLFPIITITITIIQFVLSL
jgi:hypothetical protein